MDSIKEEIRKEKDFLKEVTPLIEGDDLAYFKDHKKFLQAGQALADDEEKMTLVLAEFVQLRNKAMFLLFRKRKLTSEIEEKFFALPSIEEMMGRVKDVAKIREDKQAEVKKMVDELHEAENKMDIFSAVCNGMSEEKAREELSKYEAQVKQSLQGK